MARKPAIQTKAGNYLLRSTRRDNLLDLMALVHAGRIAVGQVNSHVTKRDGSWAGHATWGTRTLEDRGLIRRSALLAEIDARRIYRPPPPGGPERISGRRVDTSQSRL
jgi:hypothetical protein